MTKISFLILQASQLNRSSSNFHCHEKITEIKKKKKRKKKRKKEIYFFWKKDRKKGSKVERSEWLTQLGGSMCRSAVCKLARIETDWHTSKKLVTLRCTGDLEADGTASALLRNGGRPSQGFRPVRPIPFADQSHRSNSNQTRPQDQSIKSVKFSDQSVT